MPYSLAEPGSGGPRHRFRLPSIRWGLGWTLWYATAFSVFVAMQDIRRNTSWHDAFGFTTWEIVGLYYGGALVAGVGLGLLRPLSGSRIGCVGLGLVAGCMCYVAFVLGVAGFGWLARALGVVPAVVGGAGLGLVVFDEVHGYGAAETAKGSSVEVTLMRQLRRVFVAGFLFLAMLLIAIAHPIGVRFVV